MDKQEFSTAWLALENRVEHCTAQQATLQLQINKDRLTRHQGRMRLVPTWDLIVAGLAAVWTGNFVADHIHGLLTRPVAAIPALLLFAFAIVEINLSVRHFIIAAALDLGQPIVESQRKIANLRRLRVKVTQWVFAWALPLWVIFPVLLGQFIFGVNFIFAVDRGWLAANVAFGIAMIPVVNWVLQKSKFAVSLQDAITGKQVSETEAFLAELAEFQQA